MVKYFIKCLQQNHTKPYENKTGTPDELSKYKFEYFMIEYSPRQDYDTPITAIQNLFNSNNAAVTIPLIVKLLLYTIGANYSKAGSLDSITSASSYRCSILTDAEFTEQPDNGNTFMLNDKIIAGLFNYFKSNDAFLL